MGGNHAISRHLHRTIRFSWNASRWIPTVVRERAPKWGEPRRVAAPEPAGPGPAEAPRDPFGDQDALLKLEEKITTLAAHINVAEHRFLRLVAEFDRRGGRKLGGHRSCADWLHYRVGLSRGAAREKVRTARALDPPGDGELEEGLPGEALDPPGDGEPEQDPPEEAPDPPE